MDPFVDRHLGPDGGGPAADARRHRLRLPRRADATPRSRRRSAGRRRWTCRPPLSEAEAQADLAALAAANHPGRAMIGLGYHGTITPAVIRRNVLENPAWYTAYTPYQPEISQGRLEALLNFQTMIADLTGLPDAGRQPARRGHRRRRGRRAGAPAPTARARSSCWTPGCCRRAGRRPRRARWRSAIEVVEAADLVEALQRHDAFAVVVQTPDADGRVRPLDELRLIAAKAHENGALVIAAADLLALTLLDAARRVGRRRRGRHHPALRRPAVLRRPARRLHRRPRRAGAAAARAPRRPVGGRRRAAPALRLALQTREQHIRREKATSNICTAQVLLAVAAAHVRRLPRARRADGASPTGSTTGRAAWPRNLAAPGTPPLHDALLRHPHRPRARAAPHDVVAAARAHGVHLRVVDADHVGVSVGEDATEADLHRCVASFGGGVGQRRARGAAWASPTRDVVLPDAPGVQRVPLRDRDDALPAGAGRPRLRARPRHDPARLVHDEAQPGGVHGADQLPGLRQPAPVRAGRGRRGLRRARSPTSSAGWPRSPATTGSACSRTPAARASSPG